MTSKFKGYLERFRDFYFPSERIVATTHLYPNEFKERLLSITAPPYRTGVPVLRRGHSFVGRVAEESASLQLSCDSLLDPVTGIQVELRWTTNGDSTTTVITTLHEHDWNPILLPLFILVGIIFLAYGTQDNILVAMLPLMFILLCGWKLSHPRRGPFPKRELHMAARALANALDIEYAELCDQNSAVLK